uniref:Uncharacterized protein n=1 Tax=Parascaris equorum TaxID=6256 RepID=A0A914S1X8_PAREQ
MQYRLIGLLFPEEATLADQMCYFHLSLSSVTRHRR